MMLDNLYPRTKARSCSSDPEDAINKIEVIDGYTSADERDLIKDSKETCQQDLVI